MSHRGFPMHDMALNRCSCRHRAMEPVEARVNGVVLLPLESYRSRPLRAGCTSTIYSECLSPRVPLLNIGERVRSLRPTLIRL